MQVTELSHAAGFRGRKAANISASIENLGSPGFDDSFLEYVRSLCGAEHFALYHVSGDKVLDISTSGVSSTGVAGKSAKLYATGGFWRHDPGLGPLWRREADGGLSIVHMNVDEIEHEEMRERIYRPHGVRERVVLCSRQPGSAATISLLRTHKSGPFSAEGLAALNTASEAIMAVVMKHVDMKQASRDASSALTSLTAIQKCLSGATPALARREGEVCARILYGMTSLGIALDLGIGEESAMTYRKRAYSRLNIGSQRELLLWYLENWSQQRVFGASARPH